MSRPIAAGALVLLGSGCNAVFGLQDTELAEPFVADARYRGCPEMGESPMFTTLPTALTTGEFPFDFTFDEAGTFAVANMASGDIVEGPIDGQELVPLELPSDSGDVLTGPRVAPEGDEMFVVVRNEALEWSVRSYTRTGARAWARGATVTTLRPAERISTPTRRTGTRRMIRHVRSESWFSEYSETTTGWSLERVHDQAALGVSAQIEDPQLSPDGLRMVFTVDEIVGRPIYYADRTSLDAVFGTAHRILQLSGDAEPRDPILTPDCVRLYFVVHPGLTYVEQ